MISQSLFLRLQSLAFAVIGTILLFSVFPAVRIVGWLLIAGAISGILVAGLGAKGLRRRTPESVSDFVERVTGRRVALRPKAYLVPLMGLEELPIGSIEIYGTTAIGRSRKHADLIFHIDDEDSPISRLHATILDEDDRFAIRDEDSTNGTFLNSKRILPLESERLQDGDVIEIAPVERGGIRFLFQISSASGDYLGPDDEIRDRAPERATRST